MMGKRRLDSTEACCAAPCPSLPPSSRSLQPAAALASSGRAGSVLPPSEARRPGFEALLRALLAGVGAGILAELLHVGATVSEARACACALPRASCIVHRARAARRDTPYGYG